MLWTGLLCLVPVLLHFLPTLFANRPGTLSTAPTASARTASERPVAASQLHDIGTVYRLLPDDTRGIPHQKFLVRTPSGRSLLIVHNTRLAPRIPDLRVHDTVEFCGDYEPNDKGGLVHWTHDDPAGRHPDGWLLHKGRYYD